MGKKPMRGESAVRSISEVVRWWALALDEQELQEVREYLTHLTVANCWFQAFWLKDALLLTVEDRLLTLKAARPSPDTKEKGGP